MPGKDFIKQAVAGEDHNGRQAVGDSAAASAKPSVPLMGIQRPRGNTQAGQDPSTGTKANRGPILAERLGARYAISVKFAAQQSPEAGNTQANGRIVRSVAGANTNFSDARANG